LKKELRQTTPKTPNNEAVEMKRGIIDDGQNKIAQ